MSKLEGLTRSPAWLAGALAALAGLGGCNDGVLTPLGPVGASERQFLLESVGVMLLVVVPVIVLTLIFAWWFRASNVHAIYRPTWSYSGKIEFTIWVIPILIVMFLAGLTWTGSHDLDPYRPIQNENKTLRVEVVSMDWKWLFIYPQLGIASLNELALPVGTPVHFDLTSATVMNAIFVPGMGSQIYTMAGMCTQMSLLSDKVGTFKGESTQFSGNGFSDMKFNVLSTDQAGFDRWVESVRQSGNSLDKPAYETMLQVHAAAAPMHYSYAEDDLFSYALHRSTKPASLFMPAEIDPGKGICRDMLLSNGVN